MRSLRAQAIVAAALISACSSSRVLDPAQPCYPDGRTVIRETCLVCHSGSLAGEWRMGAPAGVNFDTDGDIQREIDLIRQTAIVDGTMPVTGSLVACNRTVLDAFLVDLAAQACMPGCSGRACGSDGCTGSCGTCSTGLLCDDFGQCYAPACVPSCAGAACGSDGCGGSCGTCGGGLACSGTSCVCPPGNTCCAPTCGGKQCGPDGCGGACGTCAALQTCDGSGACIWQSKSFGTDVWPIFQAAGCGTASCHGGTRPASKLDLSTQTNAYSGLVNVLSQECVSKLLVKSGDVTGSYLVNKLTGIGMCSGSIMPKGGAALSSGSISTIEAWIGSGAAP
jgi:hypothetical protein